MVEKSFFRIRVKEDYPHSTVIVKDLGRVTKTWQIKKGKALDYAAYSGLEVQTMIKEGNAFIPDPNSVSEIADESSGTGGSLSNSPAPEPCADETVTESEISEDGETQAEPSSYDFTGMSVEQLKSYLSAKGVSSGELRGKTKAELIALAEDLSQSESESENA
jgi:hypothetical protein